jgi:hypothetical protein
MIVKPFFSVGFISCSMLTSCDGVDSTTAHGRGNVRSPVPSVPVITTCTAAQTTGRPTRHPAEGALAWKSPWMITGARRVCEPMACTRRWCCSNQPLCQPWLGLVEA